MSRPIQFKFVGLIESICTEMVIRDQSLVTGGGGTNWENSRQVKVVEPFPL